MYTLDQYNSLVAAIAQGALRVRYGDKEVEYRSLTEMKSIKADMEKQLTPPKGKGNRTYGGYSKGIL